MQYKAYDHFDLNNVFADIIFSLRVSLSMVFEQYAIKLELQEKQFGIKVAVLGDKNLLSQAIFILAVKASVSHEMLRANFPAQSKIGTVEQISQLVNLQLPGIKLEAMAVAPRQIPFYSGYTYFQLDKHSEIWSQMKTSGGFAFHVSGHYPELQMEFWAIKE
jgi:type VI secretion system protein ImpJ